MNKRYFKFKETVILWNNEYKKGLELEIRSDNGVWDIDGSWLFDADSTLALKNGIVINK